ncbi:hypothetical protein DAERI_010161 [Deinococcus aerius]|uniref:Uncharacterized protein n=1 Tax=Deinococcus aerius TaxID=200253 RepID=A0A2I9CR83_9DEIO|nr:hypothetical protein DAERI_010161 [Deinococcus aerius]
MGLLRADGVTKEDTSPPGEDFFDPSALGRRAGGAKGRGPNRRLPLIPHLIQVERSRVVVELHEQAVDAGVPAADQ